MKRFLVSTIVGLGLTSLISPAALSADELCGACERKVLVTGRFEHHTINPGFIIEGAPRRREEAFREEIVGSNFAVSVPNLDAGKYTAIFGFAETDFGEPRQRLFNISCGEQVVVTNLDLFATAGGSGKVYLLKTEVDHAGDALRGPLTFTFSAQVGPAKLNTFELRTSSGLSLVSLRAADLINTEDTDALKVPEISGPVLWKDPAQPLEARVKDLVSRLSLAEKVAQMRNAAPSIPRLGVPSYDYWNECLHGVARAGTATVFPQAIGMAATWNVPLLHKVADVIATEARAKHNEYVASHEGDSARYSGLTFWTPNINLFRDPRWGRGQETYGEDPFLTARLAVSFIRGLQGDDPKYVKAMACAKHFAVHSGPETERHRFNVTPSDRDLYESYLPQFEAAVREGHVGAVMGAYNRLNGEPACSSPFLLTELLRKQWGFDGHVVSDCGAIYDIFANHQVVASSEEAAARAVKAGCDLCCGADYNSLTRAVLKGLLTAEDIDTAVGRLFTARFRLGLFDPPASVPYAHIPISENDSGSHEGLALRVARESVVLLKNDDVLPLRRDKIKRVAVVGPNADSVPVLIGNYNGDPARPITLLAGIQFVAGTNVEVIYAPGCRLATRMGAPEGLDLEAFASAIKAAKSADVVVFAGGIDARLEGEEMPVDFDGFASGDRTRIELPEIQTGLLDALHSTGKPVVLVNFSGSAVAFPNAKDVPAIVQAWYPGEQGGLAVAEVLFGDTNPGGRLPVTFYRSTEDLPPFRSYSMANRTYRYFDGTPSFAFGHGLSYTRFEYRNAALDNNKASCDQTLHLSFDLKNAGAKDGDEVAQVYFRHVNPSPSQAHLALCGFVRVSVPKKQTAKITIGIPLERFRSWNPEEKRYTVVPGDYELLLGAASDDIRTRLPLHVTAQ